MQPPPRHWWDSYGHPAYPELSKAVTWMGFRIKVLQGAALLGYLVWSTTERLSLAASLALVTALFFQVAFDRDPQWLTLRRKAARLRRAGFSFFPAGIQDQRTSHPTIVWLDHRSTFSSEPSTCTLPH